MLGRKSWKKPERTDQTANEKLFATRSSKGFHECVHSLGYLRNLPQNTPVPNECFGCQKVMRCLFPDEQNQPMRVGQQVKQKYE